MQGPPHILGQPLDMDRHVSGQAVGQSVWVPLTVQSMSLKA